MKISGIEIQGEEFYFIDIQGEIRHCEIIGFVISTDGKSEQCWPQSANLYTSTKEALGGKIAILDGKLASMKEARDELLRQYDEM